MYKIKKKIETLWLKTKVKNIFFKLSMKIEETLKRL